MGWGCVVCDEDLLDEILEVFVVDVVHLLGLIGLFCHLDVWSEVDLDI